MLEVSWYCNRHLRPCAKRCRRVSWRQEGRREAEMDTNYAPATCILLIRRSSKSQDTPESLDPMPSPTIHPTIELVLSKHGYLFHPVVELSMTSPRRPCVTELAGTAGVLQAGEAAGGRAQPDRSHLEACLLVAAWPCTLLARSRGGADGPHAAGLTPHGRGLRRKKGAFVVFSIWLNSRHMNATNWD